MKRIIIKLLLFTCTILLTFSNQIEKNKKRIQQIDSQVSKNNQKINKNKTEINQAKKTENITVNQVKVLDTNIKKLQREYNEAEKKYREILEKIGVNKVNINNDIAEINKNTEIINVTKKDLYNKVLLWDKIRRKKEVNPFMNNNSNMNNKINHDLKIIFNKQKDYIQGVENLKKLAENKKVQEEIIKAKNETEANQVNVAKMNLEKKNKELNLAKAQKNKLIAQLRGKQATLNTENKKIEKTNTNLVAEKKKLNAQIQAIIQRAIRERELALKKAEEEKRSKEAAKVQKSTTTSRNNTELAGKKIENSNKNSSNNNSSLPKTTSAPKTKGTGNLIRPINGSVVVNFGQEKAAGLKSNGIEIRGVLGQSVKAADSGVVIYAGSLTNLGGVVIIDHGSLVTVYGNLAGISVSKGSSITKGQTIGTLGRDQTTKSPNLYFEVRKGINIVNPLSYI